METISSFKLIQGITAGDAADLRIQLTIRYTEGQDKGVKDAGYALSPRLIL
jgi:hypothetical protein